MKTTKMLCKKYGENSTTAASPVRPFVEGQDEKLLEVTGTFCLNSGDDRLVTCKVYETAEITLPDWLDPTEWANNTTSWKWAWGCGVDQTWPEHWQRTLAKGNFSTAEKLALVKLLKTKNFRSDFRRSLAEQVKAWLDTPADDRKYNRPLSPRQMDALVDRYTALDAKRLDSSLYYAR
jgi:hypothetical protein